MTYRAELPRLRIHIGQCPDPLRPVTDPQTDFIASVRAEYRLYRHLHLISPALDIQKEATPLAGRDPFYHLLFSLDPFSIDLIDSVSGIQHSFSRTLTRTICFRHLSQPQNQDAIGSDIDPDRCSHRDQIHLRPDLYPHLF